MKYERVHGRWLGSHPWLPTKLICTCSLLNIFAHRIIEETEGEGTRTKCKQISGQEHGFMGEIETLGHEELMRMLPGSGGCSPPTRTRQQNHTEELKRVCDFCCALALGLAGCGVSRARVEGDAAWAACLNMQLGVAGRGLGRWDPLAVSGEGDCWWAGPLAVSGGGLTLGWSGSGKTYGHKIAPVSTPVRSKTRGSSETRTQIIIPNHLRSLVEHHIIITKEISSGCSGPLLWQQTPSALW
jgi:hypothetical protein